MRKHRRREEVPGELMVLRPLKIVDYGKPVWPESSIGRQMEIAYRIIRRMYEEDCTVVLAAAGALSVMDFFRQYITPFIRAGLIDILVTTGANYYHDLQRVIDPFFWKINPRYWNDGELRQKGFTRVYDIIFRYKALCNTDSVIKMLLKEMPQRRVRSSDIHYTLGKWIKDVEDQIGVPEEERSLMSTCVLAGIPMLCGAPYDSSIMLTSVMLSLLSQEYNLTIDGEKDVFESGAYHYFAQKTGSKRIAAIILGGGVPKNFALQPEPLLTQTFYLTGLENYSYDVQICDAVVDNASLSSCGADEAHTWGKTSASCMEVGSQYVRSDVTVAWPYIAQALAGALARGEIKREPRRLYSRSREIQDFFFEAVIKNRAEIEKQYGDLNREMCLKLVEEGRLAYLEAIGPSRS